MATVPSRVKDAESLEADLARVAAELSQAHPEVPTSLVSDLVQRTAASLRTTAKITEFIPVLVRNQVATALRQPAA